MGGPTTALPPACSWPARGSAAGVVGAHPSLARDQLDAGDLRHHTDFRRVYATLLAGWLGADSADVLGGKFEALPFLRA